MRLFYIFQFLFITVLFGALTDEKRIEVAKVGDNRYLMRLYFNYENPYQIETILMGLMGNQFVTVPIPNRLEIIKMRAEIRYVPSLVLYHARSTIAITSNNIVIRQFNLNEQRFKDSGVVTISANVPINTLDEYNKIGAKLIQHYSSGQGKEDIEDTSAPELWTQIDLKNSYVEFVFSLKPFEEKLSSITKFMFDNKNIFKDSINFVFPKIPTDIDFYNYAFMSNLIGNILKYRDVDFSVSTKILDHRNNILIMSRKDIVEKLTDYKDDIKDFDNKISGNINVIRNPKQIDKGFLIVTGESDDEIKNALYRMVNKDIQLLEEQNLKITKTDIPPKSQPYSTPGFISTGNKVLFSDLGYKTRTFFGEQPEILYLDFNLYPTVKYEATDALGVTMNVIQGGIMRSDSATNIYINDILAFQIKTSQIKEDDIGRTSLQKFETANKNLISTRLLKKGKNSLKMEFAMVPVNGPALIRFNNDILKFTLRDDSSITFPRAKAEIELPNLSYISELAFPFSIYPDLQNTGILITNFDSRTVASAMYVAFYLGKRINYPAYRLTVTADINKIINKDIITVGSQVERYALLYQNAPIQFTKDGVIKEIALSSKYIDEGSLRIKQHTSTTKIIESTNLKDYLVVQTYQSPFNKRRVILEISSLEPTTLIKGIEHGFSPIHLGKFDGDVWLYNIVNDESYSFRLKETYVLDEVVDGYSKDIEIKKVNEF